MRFIPRKYFSLNWVLIVFSSFFSCNEKKSQTFLKRETHFLLWRCHHPFSQSNCDIVFVTVLNRTKLVFLTEAENQMQSNILKYKSILKQKKTTAKISPGSKEYKKIIVLCFAFTILSMLSWSFLPRKTSAEISFFGWGWISVFILPNPIKNNYMRCNVEKYTRSCINLNLLDAAHKEERSDIDASLSWECEVRMSSLAT